MTCFIAQRLHAEVLEASEVSSVEVPEPNRCVIVTGNTGPPAAWVTSRRSNHRARTVTSCVVDMLLTVPSSSRGSVRSVIASDSPATLTGSGHRGLVGGRAATETPGEFTPARLRRRPFPVRPGRGGAGGVPPASTARGSLPNVHPGLRLTVGRVSTACRIDQNRPKPPGNSPPVRHADTAVCCAV